MWSNIRAWISHRFHRTVNSIAFYPVVIAILFLLLSMTVISFDFSEEGKHLKSQLHWLSLKDASTARSIISAIAAGIISLTVFSFSMVMIVLNQAASQMSNRILDKLIGNRFQQIVLGIYIGTIVYALFLLSTIRDIDSGLYIPAFSTYLLILLTVFDIFLFIYFLHYITQTVKYKVVIDRIHKETQKALEQTCQLTTEPATMPGLDSYHLIMAERSGIYEGYNESLILAICEKNDCLVELMHIPGTFVLEGIPVIKVNRKLKDEIVEHIARSVFIHPDETIDENFFYGFRQLTEVAVKALSPGVNDPGTAVISLRALFELLLYRSRLFPKNVIADESGKTRIITNALSFETIFTESILPIWDYGKEDRMIQNEMHKMLAQLQSTTSASVVQNLLEKVRTKQAEKEY